jgi:hypothetical protein
MQTKFRFEDVPSNNHGCSGFSIVVEKTGERTGVIIEVNQCTHNCHGISGTWYQEGQEFTLPEEFSTWDEAEEWFEDETSFSSAGNTKLRP